MYQVSDTPITRERLEQLLACVKNARIGLIGDFCLDLYWLADMRLSELSRETPHHPLPVVEERYAPGGAGNAACNIAALKPGRLSVCGLVGNDWRGTLLLNALRERGVDTGYVVAEPSVVTNAYIKPLRSGISDVIYEDPRLDFENRAPINDTCENRLLEALEEMAHKVDVICVSDQLRYGCITPRIRARLCEWGRAGKTVIVDSRDRAAEYDHVTLKPNEVEASRAFGDGSEQTLDALAALAERISLQNGRVTLMTLGARGCFVAEGSSVIRCPACRVEPPIDFCGAGDTFLAGYATLLAAGAAPLEAAQTATLCSAVTIRKIGMTGTATKEEVMNAWDLYHGAGEV